MKTFITTTAAVGALVAATLGLAGPATAAATGPGDAQDTVGSLQAQGYSVQLNGPAASVPLSQCTVTGMHGMPSASAGTTQFTTVYVDVSCQDDS
ncbi:hypothetical protein [Mycolicibacterium sp.]|uniref:hypothetical protein n=1 Tax=Mycolicibacterium sp. TaxID=2320850 RepID=UPI001A21B3B7|nr:hypothetical protein [Mycolicibacterium sp.]MBJ7339582.1 hypothetical protein [Mycolicibacterium sp.]